MFHLYPIIRPNQSRPNNRHWENYPADTEWAQIHGDNDVLLVSGLLRLDFKNPILKSL